MTRNKAMRIGLKPLWAVPLVIACGGEQQKSEGPGIDKLVYAVRQHTVVDAEGVSIDVAGGMGQVMDYLRYVPGGAIEIFDLSTRETQNVLKDFSEADVSGLDLSFDATKIVFSMKQNADDRYHIYTAELAPDQNGNFVLHQVTFGDYDDIHPVWLAGDRIAFGTNQGYTEMGTRADEYNHARQVTQIATASIDGADRKLCSQNLSHTINLFSLKDGRVGFSRWEHLENINDVKLFAMNPDCTQMAALTGQHGKNFNSFIQVAEGRDANTFLGVATSRENTIQAGALLLVDARSAEDPTRVDEELPTYTVLTDTPLDEEPSSTGRYRTPYQLQDGRILTSWAKGFVNDLNELSLTPPDFGVYVYDRGSKTNQLVVNHEGTWELYARPVVPREAPVVLPTAQNTADPNTPAIFGSIDIKQTSLTTVHGETVSGAQFTEATDLEVALGQAKRVRIIEGFSSEGAPGVTMFGLTMAEGAALLGEATVEADGSWLASIPPYVPVHLQPIDEFDLAIRNQTLWIQGMPGESRVCGGCHERRALPNIPSGQQLTNASAKNPRGENFVVPIAERIEYPWDNAATGATNEIQAIFDARCTSCHNGTTNGDSPQEFYTVSVTEDGTATTYQIPRLDLTSTPITVNYDREVAAWPASYVSIFYPSAIRSGEVMDADVSGALPPEWGIPSDARHSALIEKLNVTSSVDSALYAWTIGSPFVARDDDGAIIRGAGHSDHATEVGLTREELVKLIRAIDMGGQYYSRQNSMFVPYSNDPLSGTNY